MAFKPLYTAGQKPTKFQLLQKDIGVNLVDKIFFFKNLRQEIIEIGTGTSSYVESSSGVNAIKQPDGTLIIVIPTVDVTATTLRLASVSVVFPISFKNTNYSISLDIVSYAGVNTNTNIHKVITNLDNKTEDGIDLQLVSESDVFTVTDTVEMSATLTGRWK